jgi:hypothetical protein
LIIQINNKKFIGIVKIFKYQYIIIVDEYN